MTKMRHNNRNTNKRSNKVSQGTQQIIEDKFEEERKLPPIQALNEKQKVYINLLKTCNIVVVNGLFGTGKSYISAAISADALRQGKVSKVIVARPYVFTGKDSGSKPGDTLTKLFPFVRNVLDTMEKRMGKGAFAVALKDGQHGDIEVQELSSIRGRSFDEPSFLLIEEAQQSTPEEMLAIVSRISDNCTLVISGDDSQRDVRGKSGLSWFTEFAKRHNLQGVGFVNFDEVTDIVRGGVVADIARGLMHDNKNGVKTPQST